MSRSAALAVLLGLFAGGGADKPEDIVTYLPGFPNSSQWGFKVYSGFLDVPGPLFGYDSLWIHYQFHTSRHDPPSDPVVTWHQGGPGSSSITIGLYGELGAFDLALEGDYLNPFAWNRLANMLYLESPAGSGGSAGYSECIQNGQPVVCYWNDTSQGEAYAHTLMAFFQAFPEFAENSLYLTGESYFGQYGPNIADFITRTEPFNSKLHLKGIALGNACWGGNATCVACNGPSEDKIDADLLFGHGMYSPQLHKELYAACQWPTTYTSCDTSTSDAPVGRSALSQDCQALIQKMQDQAGAYDIYFLYNNCPYVDDFLKRTGKDMAWLRRFLRKRMHNPGEANRLLTEMNGGYQWHCDGPVEQWITRDDVRKALHLDGVKPGASDFQYTLSGPASITIYPSLVQKMRVLIYSGQADACVPYLGTEEWIQSLVDVGVLHETSPWTPWYLSDNNHTAAGYITAYETAPAGQEFTFQTVRLAGHMVPQFQPKAAFEVFAKFLAGGREKAEVSVVV